LNLSKLWYWFWTTLGIGAIATLGTVAVLMALDNFFVLHLKVDGYLFNLFNTSVTGMMFGAFALMGFFSYLMVNYIALSIIRKPDLWKAIQIILTIIVLIDLVALPLYLLEHPKAWYWYMIVPILLVAASLYVARMKVKATNANAWVPTMFFMIVGTAIEVYPALKIDSFKEISFMLVPVFVCNAWQIMQLHKLVKRSA
jgi:KinB signaling pathway activation protein